MGGIIKCNAQLKHKYQKQPLRISQLTTPKKYFNESSGELEQQSIPINAQQTIIGVKNTTNPTEVSPQNQQISAVGQTLLLKEDDDIVQYRTLQQTISNTLTHQFFSNTSIEEQKFQNDDYFDGEELKKFEQQLQKFKKGKRIKGAKISWKQGELIGTGSFGRVYKGLNLVTGEIMAIKQFLVIGNSKEQQIQKRKILEQEIELLSTLVHKNIVKYQGIERDNENINIFLEFISGGSLSQMIKKFGSLNDTLIKLYTKQILEGLEYLHVNEVVHRDIKGANVLIEKNGVAKLSDFGSAKRIVTQVNDQEQLATLTGTPNWFSDIWSLGCTVIEMATGKPPYHQHTNPIVAMFNIARDSTPPAYPDNCSSILRDFLDNCFKQVPYERLNVSKLLNHKFITGIQQINRNIDGHIGEEQKSKEKKVSTSGNQKIYYEQENPFKELQQQQQQQPILEGTKFNSNFLNFIECRFTEPLDDRNKTSPSWMKNNLFNFSMTNSETKKIFPKQKVTTINQSPELQAEVEKQKTNQFLSTIDSTNYLQLYDTDQNKVSITSQINLKLFDGKQSNNFQNANNNNKISNSILQSKEKKMLNWLDQQGGLSSENNQNLSRFNELKLLEFIDEDENSFLDDIQQKNITPKQLQNPQNQQKVIQFSPKHQEQQSIEKTLELQLILESIDQQSPEK